jgi:CRP/FNR family cyclic AMP-dependent transcriptional regulator
MTSSTTLAVPAPIEDVLEHLPVSSTREYSKGQMIYGPDEPSKGIHLVVSGKVEIWQVAGKGKELLMEIVRPDELFGESAFIDPPCRTELASAFEATRVMTWPISQVEDLVMKRPRLAMALLQVLVRRNAENTRRIESFSTESIEQRLVGALVRFSERLGTAAEDGTFTMMAVSHQKLSRYVGTSREIITQHMNRFRKQGYVSYSRQGIVLYPQAMNALTN